MEKILEEILYEYYQNEAKKLRDLVDRVLFNLHFNYVDHDDFYSVANEVFAKIIKKNDYDLEKGEFEGFLYSCLSNKFKSEMTKNNRLKRKILIEVEEIDECGKKINKVKQVETASLDAPIYEGSTRTLGDVIAETRSTTDFDIDKTFFDDDGEKYTEKMLRYISRLSNLQKEVVKLIIAGYKADEIKNILHINQREYSDAMMAIHSYRNISILM